MPGSLNCISTLHRILCFAPKEHVPMGFVSVVAKPRVLAKRDLRSCGQPTSNSVARHRLHSRNCYYLFVSHMRHRLHIGC